jgi:alcohol dehydrogenase
MPFVAGCGHCRECDAGAAQVCDRQFQPGFTAWGAFAERVAVPYADFNLVRLPDTLDFVTAASLGCRLSTAYRAVALQGRVAAGQWVAVHGCGGVGLSAVMIARALGARVVAVDIRDDALELAKQFGAESTISANRISDVPLGIRELTDGGAHVSLDALGGRVTCANSIRGLRKRGRHVQVGLLAGDDATPPVPMELVVARELEIAGSHGLAAADYAGLFRLIETGKIDPRRLVLQTIRLDEVPTALPALGTFDIVGMTVVDRY